MITSNLNSSSLIRNYGLTDEKKSMLVNLAREAADANYEVENYLAKVSSLKIKVERCQLLLADAELMRSKAKNNKGLLDELILLVAELQSQSGIINKEMINAADKTTALCKELNSVMQKLIYTGSLVNLLLNTVMRKKARDPLISDELVYRINKAAHDTNNVVSLTLIAFNSTIEAYIKNGESASAVELTQKNCVTLNESLTGKGADSTVLLFNETCDNSEAYLKMAQSKLDESTNQLNEALLQLNTAQIKLNSLQMGLAAVKLPL